MSETELRDINHKLTLIIELLEKILNEVQQVIIEMPT